MRVNIIYEINNREYNNCVLLQRELIRRGHKAYVYNKTEDIVFRDEKAITIIPNSYCNKDVLHYRYIFNTKNNPVIMYPCEQINNHKMPQFFDYSEKSIVKKLPIMCWGKDYYDFIHSIGFKNKDNQIVGAIQLDFCRTEFRKLYLSREELSKKYNLPYEKKWVLFISDFVYTSELIVNHLLETGDSPQIELLQRAKFSNDSYEKILEWFYKLLEDNEEYVIIYRKHPVEMITNDLKDKFQNMKDKFFVISDLNIKEWIVNCDIITTWNSTAVVESYMAQKNVQLLRPYDFSTCEYQDEYTFYKNYKKYTSYEQFCDAISNNENNYSTEVIREINKFYDVSEKPSYMRLADEIEKIGEQKTNLKVEKNYYLKRWMYILKTIYIPKIIIKKIYQCLYLLVAKDRYQQKERKIATEEWAASALNRKGKKLLDRKIDSIIRQREEKE